MTKEKPQTAIPDPMRQTQDLFKLNGGVAPQFEQVQKVHETMLKDAQTFAEHWFERRQEATRRAAEALQEMNSSGKPDPVAAMQAISEWQRGSVERLKADFQEWIALWTRAAHLAARTQAPVAPSDSDQGKSGKAKGAASLNAKADHATPV